MPMLRRISKGCTIPAAVVLWMRTCYVEMKGVFYAA